MKAFLTSIIIFFVFSSQAQYFSWGNDPSSIRWKQINTPQFQIIYPEENDSIAQHFANMLEYVYDECGKSLNHAPKKISVVLHTKSNIANGSVAWAPKRMDIFDVVPQNQIPQVWFEQLAIHEFRHVVQIDKLNQGLTRIIYFLFGEQAIGGISGIYLPSWFLEGDAVCTETALSNSGRGRQADFSMGLRAQLLEKKRYSYLKAYFGSYKNYVPNRYEMGYVVVANAREKYGPEMWEKVETRVAQKPLSIKPFNKSIKKQTGLNKRELYKEMFDKQAIEWKLQYEREIQKPFDTLTKRNPKQYTNYIHAYRISDSQIITERIGIGNSSQIVLLSPGAKALVLANTSFKQSDERIHTNGNIIVWSENHPDIRWELRGTADIYMYSLSTNKAEKIKTKRRVYSPCISAIGDKIVAVEIDEKSNYWIVVYETSTKKEIQRIASPNHEYILTPSWNYDGTKIVFVAISTFGKRIVELDVNTLQTKDIISYTYDDISNPIYWNDFIVYSSSYSGVDNLYAINTGTKEISRLTVSSFGCKYPSIYKNTLLFSDYSSDGFMVGQLPVEPRTWHSLEVVRKEPYSLAQTLTRQEGEPIQFSKLSDSTFAVTPYSKILHAINIHSWMPFYLEYNGNQVSDQGLGFQFISQDKLGTTSTSVGYKQNLGKSRKAGFAKITYTGLFPVFEFEYLNGTQIFTDIQGLDTVKIKHHVSEVNGRISLPFNFSSRSYYRYVTLAAQSQYGVFNKISVDPVMYDNLYKKYFEVGILSYTVSFMNVLQPSSRDIKPRLGQIFQAGFQHAPFQHTELYGDYVFSSLQLYLPGFYTNHSFEIYGGFEWNKDTVTNNFQSQIETTRGYATDIYLRKEMYSLHANYTFPILYPDAYWLSICYIKRLRGNVFVDYAQTTHIFDNSLFINTSNDRNLFSFGLELVADMHVLHMPVPINWGYRFGYVPQKQLTFGEAILMINFADL